MKIFGVQDLLWDIVLFGFTAYSKKCFYLINLLICLQISSLIKKPNFMVLLTEERLYIDSNRNSLNKKTIKTFVSSTV